MTDAIMQAYLEVERAMEQYNKVLQDEVAMLRSSESADATKLERMTHGARAMRDSSMIYLLLRQVHRVRHARQRRDDPGRPPDVNRRWVCWACFVRNRRNGRNRLTG